MPLHYTPPLLICLAHQYASTLYGPIWESTRALITTAPDKLHFMVLAVRTGRCETMFGGFDRAVSPADCICTLLQYLFLVLAALHTVLRGAQDLLSATVRSKRHRMKEQGNPSHEVPGGLQQYYMASVGIDSAEFQARAGESGCAFDECCMLLCAYRVCIASTEHHILHTGWY